jgi:hypothetical protein
LSVLVFGTLFGVATSCAGSDESATAGIAGRTTGGTGFGARGGSAATTTGGSVGSGGSAAAGVGGTTVDAEAGPQNPLCGTGCPLDDPNACLDAGAAVPDAAFDTNAQSDATVAEGGLDAGAEHGDVLDAAVATDGAVEAEPPQVFGCRLQVTGGERIAACAPAGAGMTGAPCISSAYCAPGYACTGDPGACRHYCCAGNDACDPLVVGEGRYCADRPLRESTTSTTEPILVPVCVKADNCNLAEPYPCPTGMQCTCRSGTACTVVRDDPPTTSCVPPGTGLEGDPCPCAWGNLCSQATGKCLKLCSISTGSTECGSGLCQSSTALPQGWGICVGTSADGG